MLANWHGQSLARPELQFVYFENFLVTFALGRPFGAPASIIHNVFRSSTLRMMSHEI